MATIKDIAREVGVSATTVSLVINGKAEERRISPETCRKVREAMTQLGYQPNAGARALRSNEDSRPLVALYWPSDNRANILSAFSKHVHEVLRELSFDCKFLIEDYVNNELEKSVGPILNGSYSAVILGGISQEDQAYLESLNPVIPVILLNRESEKYSTVGSDNKEIGMSAARLFKLSGYSSCAVFTSRRPYVATGIRTQAFLKACNQLGIDVKPEHIYYTDSTIESGAKAAERYCDSENPPNAVFCDSDMVAIGALSTFNRRGLRLPDDIALLSIALSDQEMTEYSIPPCSVIAMPGRDLLKACLSAVRLHLETPDAPLTHEIIKPYFIPRKTFS